MTPREFKKRMEEIERKYGGDAEAAHAYADDLMCDLLRELGYGEGVHIFTLMEKWYA